MSLLPVSAFTCTPTPVSCHRNGKTRATVDGPALCQGPITARVCKCNLTGEQWPASTERERLWGYKIYILQNVSLQTDHPVLSTRYSGHARASPPPTDASVTHGTTLQRETQRRANLPPGCPRAACRPAPPCLGSPRAPLPHTVPSSFAPVSSARLRAPEKLCS